MSAVGEKVMVPLVIDRLVVVDSTTTELAVTVAWLVVVKAVVDGRPRVET